MFNENWVALAAFAVILGLLTQQPGLLAIAILVLLTAAAGWLWNEHSLRGIQYRRVFSERRAFLGETVDLRVEVTNRKPLPVAWVKIDDEFPSALAITDGPVRPSTKPDIDLLANLVSLRWFERVRWSYRIRCDQRGFYAFGPTHLQSGDLFGLFQSESTSPQLDWLIIYPQVRPLEMLDLPPKEPFGDVRARQRIFEDPSRAIGVRDYRPSDALKTIHWKATARRQQLQVKVYEPTTSHQLVIFLNMVTLPRPWQGTIPELLERCVSVAASVASFASEKRLQVGLLANGCWPQSDQPLKVLPGRSPDQLTLILEALAAVSALPTISLEDLLTREAPGLPWGATLVIVTALASEELLAALGRLQAAGRRVVLIRLDDEPLPIQVPRLPVRKVIDLGDAFGLEAESMP